MKKKLALILAAAMTLSAVSVNVAAEEEYPEVTVIINDTELESDQPAIIIDGRTMVPLRAIGEALDVEVNWENDTKTVVFSKAGITATMVVGETVLTISDGEVAVPVEIDSPAVIVNSRTLVPVRFVSENFGATVDWDADTRTVTITSEAAAEEEPAEEPVFEHDAEAVAAAKALMDEINTYAELLNDHTEEMSEEQAKAYAEYCDAGSGAGVVLDSASQAYTDEDVASITESLNEAITGLDALVKDLGLEEEYAALVASKTEDKETEGEAAADEETSLDVVKELIEKVEGFSAVLANVDMDEDQTEIYNGFEESLNEVKESVDKLETEEDCTNAIDILTGVEKGFENLAEELEISLS